MNKFSLYINKKKDLIIIRDEVSGRGAAIWASYLSKFNGNDYRGIISRGWDTSQFTKMEGDVKIVSNDKVTFRISDKKDLLIEFKDRRILIGKQRFTPYNSIKSIKANTVYNVTEKNQRYNQYGDLISSRNEMVYDIWSEPLKEVIFKPNKLIGKVKEYYSNYNL